MAMSTFCHDEFAVNFWCNKSCYCKCEDNSCQFSVFDNFRNIINRSQSQKESVVENIGV